jgi:D-glycero-alpha-D-manno-heptose-7-phosphate kinase
MAIDKYTYVSCRYLPPFFPDYVHRIVYSQIELVRDVGEIRHPSVRECIRFVGIPQGLNVQHESDLPARTGLGSSSSFTVGLLRALHALQGQQPSKLHLAREAIHVERDLLHENVGVQDQLAAAFGGFNVFEFEPGGRYRVTPVVLTASRLRSFLDHLVLIFTGFQRNASDIAADQVAATPRKRTELRAMRELVFEGLQVLQGGGDLDDFGRLLRESWELKRSLTRSISTPPIDCLYTEALRAGASGGKLLGAGGGGFVLLFVEPERRLHVIERVLNLPMNHLVYVPFGVDRLGSEIVVYQPEEPEFIPAELVQDPAWCEVHDLRVNGHVEPEEVAV